MAAAPPGNDALGALFSRCMDESRRVLAKIAPTPELAAVSGWGSHSGERFCSSHSFSFSAPSLFASQTGQIHPAQASGNGTPDFSQEGLYEGCSLPLATGVCRGARSDSR